jgi:hypothetical protein
MDEETENWYRENLDMPFLLGKRPPSEDEVKLQLAKLSASASAANGNGNPNGKGTVQPNGRHSGTGNTGPDPGFEATAG